MTECGVITSSTLVMKIRQGVLSGEWDEKSAREFDRTYRPYLLRYLRIGRWKGFWKFHEEIVSQAFVRLFPYIAKGWQRQRTGAFRNLLKMIVDHGAAQDVIRQELDLMETDEIGANGKPIKVPRVLSIEQMKGNVGDDAYLTRDEQIELARKHAKGHSIIACEKIDSDADYIRWHRETLYLAIINVLGEVEDRDDRIVWARLIDRTPSKEVARVFGVTDNNVNVITNRKLRRIGDLAKELMNKFVYNGKDDPDRTFKGMWRQISVGAGRERVNRIEQAIAQQLAQIEKNEQLRAGR